MRKPAMKRLRAHHPRFTTVFAAEHPVPFVLNVAGPRESKSPGIQSRPRIFLDEVLNGMFKE